MVKLLLTDPKAAFAGEKKTELPVIVKYFAVLSVFYAVMTSVWNLLFPGIAFFFISLVSNYVIFFVVTSIEGLIIHFFAYVFGAKGGLKVTLKVVFYSMTPVILLGWLPWIGALFSIWAIMLQIIGLKSLHEMSTEKATLAVIIPMAIMFVFYSMFLFMSMFWFLMNPQIMTGMV